MTKLHVPIVNAGLIGGSGIWGARFPEDFPELGLRVLEHLTGFDTPFGESAPFKLLAYKDYTMLYVAMHGGYPNSHQIINPYFASQQVAWVFRQAKCRWVLTGGSVGGICSLDGEDLPPWSIMIPYDFVMWPSVVQVKSEVSEKPSRSIFYRLAHPFCPILSNVLYNNAKIADGFSRVEIGGVYVCTPFGRFETAAEIRLMRLANCNVVGQTVGHEAITLRREGIPVASLNIVSNYAEEGARWIGDDPSEMSRFYQNCPKQFAPVWIGAIKQIFDEGIEPSSLEQFAIQGLEQFPVEES